MQTTQELKSKQIYSCQVQEMMKLLGKKWSLLIIKCISRNKEISFTELKKELKISQKILWQRLEELEKEDLITNFECTQKLKKKEFRSIYSLTQKGAQIEKFLELFEGVEKNN
ncbi:MAG: winged helix-turn-helix transcriptional regulator [Nanoarchaeota archaeon]|nr:winged helix-turn-helix transcriptional regulator [Nanoarchaeota archaeon]